MKPPIYLIESESRQVLAETFMRFQEHYESPVFGGKVFSAGEFADWYASEYGDFTYHKDWSGFNIPSKVLKPFIQGDFDPLTAREQKLVELARKVKGEFYIIGATREDEDLNDTIKHEFVHGAFATNPEYRQDVIRCIKAHRPEVVRRVLAGMGYGDNVLDDEINAYLLTEPETLEEDVCHNEGFRLSQILDNVFKKYFGFSMAAARTEAVVARTEKLLI